MFESDLGNFTGACPCSVDWDPPDIYDRAIRKARKEYTCIECRARIEKGQQYEYVRSLFEGSWETYRTCLPCAHLARSLGCRQHHGLWEQFYEMFGWSYTEDPADWEEDDDDED